MKDHKGYYHPSHKSVTSEDEMKYLRDGTFLINGLPVEGDNIMPGKYVIETKVNDDRVPEARKHRPQMFVKIPDNTEGIDYICGDIHGCMDELHATLTEVGFDYFKDRLFCTGDLTDRGASSHRALRLIREPWFYTVLGNHEDMILDSFRLQTKEAVTVHRNNGGDWFYDQPLKWQVDYVDELKKLPMGIQVGDVAIVHADYPFNKWDLESLQSMWESGDYEATLKHALTWSRETIEGKGEPRNVKEIQYIYCGHTIVSYPVEIGNIRFIDTGAFTKKGYLTLFKLHWKPPVNNESWYTADKTS